MLSIALKGALARRRRLVSTCVAVCLGVAFLSGTLALGDTLRANFDELFTDANAGTDVVVRRASVLEAENGFDEQRVRAPIPADVVDTVADVDGVETVVPVIAGYGQLRGADGDAVGMDGPPRLAGNWIADPDLNPYRIVEGRAPERAGEVVVNRGAAEDGDLGVGDTTTVEVPQPVPVTVVGIATFVDADGAGASTFTAFTTDEAADLLLGGTDQVSSVAVQAADGVSAEELRQRIAAVVPDGVEALTGAAITDEAVDDINADFLSMLTGALTAFAAIAMLVATFSIANTFATLVAQRTQESALLRALGASRRQVRAAVVVETLAVGIIGSVAGVVAGIGLAGLLKGMFDAFGFALPAGGLVYDAGTVIVALIVGLVATVVAGAAPAMRASRTAPLAAIRDVAVDRSSSSLARLVFGLAVTALGVGLVLSALGSDDGIAQAGIGAAATVVGVVALGPIVAAPASTLLGAPVAGARGLIGSLARRNAARNPRRTAASASALLIGVSVVSLFTVFGASMRASITDTVDRAFAGDLVVASSAFGGTGVDPQLAADVRALPDVDAAAGLGGGVAAVGGLGVGAPAGQQGEAEFLTMTDAGELDAVADLDVVDGSLGDLGPGAIAVADDDADDLGVGIGDRVPVTYADGVSEELMVVATFVEDEIAGPFVVARETLAPHVQQAMDRTVLIALADGVPLAEGRAAVERIADRYGSPDVQDRDEYAEATAGGIETVLGIVYALLALAIVIALLGIATTLSLSVHERTRELGLLRAVGQTRGQLRAMVRWESTIVATFGTLGGLALGTFLGWAVVQAAGSPLTTFALPTGSLLLVLVIGGIAGVLAGVRPARRAARMDVLAAVNVR